MSKSIVLAFLISAALLAPAVATPAGDAALAPIKQFSDGMNAGDAKKAAGAYAASVSIIDEFAPHHWSSFADWNRDLGGFFKVGGVSDFHMTLSPASFKQVGASQAYAVVPTVLTYKVKGKATTEKGIFTFALAKDAGAWHIAAWAWTTL
jgi:hypothetical protein